jgi:hypothetical protein
MKRTSKILLASAVALFAAGSTPVGSGLLYGILKPIAAVLVIVVFLIELLPAEETESQNVRPAKADAKGRPH